MRGRESRGRPVCCSSPKCFYYKIITINDFIVNPLGTRLFGTWTLVSAVVRFYAAYHISNSVVYEITLWTYYIAAFHFLTEWLIFKSVRFGIPLAGPLIISIVLTIIWMNISRDNYILVKI
ncbi:hypothetical protein PORY_000351 [Pneumocystis oryctolagi]|uniref:Uncharacterized protein n=1 Tax=Pneumocystis oryctolagi TaxID=42067 RepID=A0ACB7CGS4_9ASCO|nr:hypothetical protein PORY_000351 [Pneumocystis oryctolagi]